MSEYAGQIILRVGKHIATAGQVKALAQRLERATGTAARVRTGASTYTIRANVEGPSKGVVSARIRSLASEFGPAVRELRGRLDSAAPEKVEAGR